MKNKFECDPIFYWRNMMKIYRNKRDQCSKDSIKFLKFNMLLKKAEFMEADWKFRLSK